jgi:hypothetical protein
MPATPRRNRGNGSVALTLAVISIVFAPIALFALLKAHQALKDDPDDGLAKSADVIALGVLILWVVLGVLYFTPILAG